MHWFLVISLIGSDDLLIKQMPSKGDCVKTQEEFKNKMPGKIRGQIEYISCEEGELMESYKTKSEEVL